MLRLGRLKVLLLVIGFFICSTTQAACVEDYLSKNQNSGRILVTAGGFIFEPLAGDNITAMLWLPMDDLLVCGPQLFPYGGKTYEIYKVTNIDDKESVSAMKIAGRGLAAGGGGASCSESSIVKPSPFMGNSGEVFVLADGSIWEIVGEYEYMYEYYPDVLVCESSGYVIVEGTKLQARRLR